MDIHLEKSLSKINLNSLVWGEKNKNQTPKIYPLLSI
jgi:hypothetical protein